MLSEVGVFGSTGFIGRNYVKKSRFKTINISKEENLCPTNEILYFIGTNHNYNIFDNPHLDIDTNLSKLIDVLETNRLAGKQFTFNFVSSWFVYGKTQIPFSENSICRPIGFYSITKYAAELLLQSFCQTYDIPFRIIRLSNVIGPHDPKVSKKRNALQYMLGEIRSNNRIELYENGEILRDYLYIDDVVEGLDLIIGRGGTGEVYNLGSGVGYMIKDLVTEYKKYINSNSEIASIPTPKFHQLIQTRDAVLNIEKISSLGFTVKRPLTNEMLDNL